MIKINDGDILTTLENSENFKSCTCKGIRICNICEEEKIKLNIVKKQEEYDLIIDLTHLIKIKEFSESVIKEFYIDFHDLESNDHFIDLDLQQVQQVKFNMFEEVDRLSQEISFENNKLNFNLAENFFEGFKLIKNFVNKEESKEIIQEINSHGWQNSQSGRKKQDFGPKINYKKRKVKFLDGMENFPSYYDKFLHNKIIYHLNDFSTAEIGNLWYSPVLGSCIDPHIDDYWVWGRIIGINFLSKTVMTFSKEFLLINNSNKNILKNENHEYQMLDNSSINGKCFTKMKVLFEINFPIDPEDAYIMTGSSRYLWKHSIKRQNIAEDRVVITLREYESVFKLNNKNK